jgi:hypothetical protein
VASRANIETSDEVPVAVISDAEMAVISQGLLDRVGLTFEELADLAVDESFPNEFARLVWFAISPLAAG